MSDIIGVLSAFVLVFLNGFFVAAEFAIVKASETRISERAEEGTFRARVAEKIVGNLDAYLSTTQLGITMASLALGWVGAPALAHILEPPLSFLGIASPTALRGASAATAFIAITFFRIVLGELVPKSVAIRSPEHTSLAIALPLLWFNAVFHPVIWAFNTTANTLLRIINISPATSVERAHSEEELRMILAASREGGHIDEMEQQLMRRALTFGERQVGDIMVPRTEMAALPADLPVEQALEELAVSNHTRYPVFGEDIDDTIGYVHVKDLYRADPTQTVRTVLRPIGFISETASLEVVLQRFQSTRTPLALVVDEHGGTAGLVTIQDVVEELIGEVRDEFDREAPLVEPADGDGYSVDGSARIDHLCEAIGLKVAEEGFPTVGGRVFEQLQRRPHVGDEVDVGNFHARVLDVDGLRISRVLMVPLESRENKREEETPGTPNHRVDGSKS